MGKTSYDVPHDISKWSLLDACLRIRESTYDIGKNIVHSISLKSYGKFHQTVRHIKMLKNGKHDKTLIGFVHGCDWISM